MSKEVVIIGAGPAGILAGISAAQAGAHVYLLEQNNIVGKKMGITGKGRCNITNTCSIDEFIQNTPGNGKFLYSVYHEYNNEDLLKDFKEWGLATKVERGGRVFPLSDSAIEVRNFLSKVFTRYGGELVLEERAKALIIEDNHVCGVKTEKGLYKADAVIIATGGVSYPVTGSRGDGHELAKSVGHKVSTLLPALVPIVTKEQWVKDIMGTALKNIKLTLFIKGKKKESYFGEMLFTHFGISGPIVLSISRTVAKALAEKKKDMYLEIDLKPAISEDTLDQRLQRDFASSMNKQLINGLKDLLPSKLLPIVFREANLSEEKVIHQITREERLALVRTLKHLTLHVQGLRPIEEAIVTCGGISCKEFNPKTMESKIVKGLYAAGEVLDIDALTGGFNLQAAFSTGYIAGREAAREDI